MGRRDEQDDFDHDGDLDDRDLDELREEAEREALRVGLSMLRSDNTPATARASVVRAILGDAAARRHDVGTSGKASHEMTAAELAAAIAANQRELAAGQRRLGFDRQRQEATDAETVDVSPAVTAEPGGVFG